MACRAAGALPRSAWLEGLTVAQPEPGAGPRSHETTRRAAPLQAPRMLVVGHGCSFAIATNSAAL